MITPTIHGGREVYFQWVKGATVEYIIPDNESVYLAWVFATYTADATVITRQMAFGFVHPAEYTHNFIALAGIVAGETKTIGWGLGSSSTAGAMPTGVGPGNGLAVAKYPLKLALSVVNGQAGDTWKAYGIYYRVPCPAA